MKILQRIALITLLIWTISSPVYAADLAQGEQIFQIHCAGCHANGGNIVRRGKNLKLKTLQRNGMDSLAAIEEIITYGKNNMSAYEARLTREEIEAVAVYVRDRAEQGWN